MWLGNGPVFKATPSHTETTRARTEKGRMIHCKALQLGHETVHIPPLSTTYLYLVQAHKVYSQATWAPNFHDLQVKDSLDADFLADRVPHAVLRCFETENMLGQYQYPHPFFGSFGSAHSTMAEGFYFFLPYSPATSQNSTQSGNQRLPDTQNTSFHPTDLTPASQSVPFAFTRQILDSLVPLSLTHRFMAQQLQLRRQRQYTEWREWQRLWMSVSRDKRVCCGGRNMMRGREGGLLSVRPCGNDKI